MKQKLQTFGRFLSGMVMPNISIFIAWGIITALFIPTGWCPNETLNALVSPMQRFLLPILIAYSGGKMVYGDRGAIIGACAAAGVTAGTETPMFIGAMIAGPLGGWCMKKVDAYIQPRTPQGFEMLFTNFSAGILGAVLAVLGCLAIEPVCLALNSALEAGVSFLVNHGLLWLTSVIVEPAKVLFLNNAINHGVFTPMGMNQVAETGKSIFFLIEANPGPGLGLLLAYCLFGKGSARESAPGALIIEFLGGIHEIYFPYVLMNPITIVGLILGGMTGVITNSLFGSGLVSAASPGSFLAILGMTARDSYVGVILSIFLAAAVSFGVNAVLLKAFGREKDVEAAKREVAESRASSRGGAPVPAPVLGAAVSLPKLAFACDAGMGSSAMGAASLTKKLKAAGADISVPHYAINDLPADMQAVVTQASLVERVKKQCPDAKIYPVNNFMGGAEYDAIVADLISGSRDEKPVKDRSAVTSSIARPDRIFFACDAGMGSSAMGAAALSKKLKAAGLSIPVEHSAINDLSRETAFVVTHESLAQRARTQCPNATICPITNFMGGAEYDAIVSDLLN
ncbi:PTS mannitol-specific transporter subunit IIBC [Faecalibaculum rodentium]|uniref:PTS mannitol-specific transporter subunit IIBC n=3 Tax=Faecalibaculum rodentium TaxID=1702221 RepID=UPI0023F15481|nr:PTS mannitol transporter subunit IICBA [Faecalibaculum rodentium]